MMKLSYILPTFSDLLFVLPVLLPLGIGGAMVRFSRRQDPKGWRVTAAGFAAALAVWSLAVPLSRHGSELPGITAYCVTGFLVGSALCGLGLRLYQTAKK